MADLREGKGVEVPFFGRPAHSNTAPALIARIYGLKLYAACVVRKPGVRFSVRVAPVAVPVTDDREADVVAATAGVQAQFEVFLRAGAGAVDVGAPALGLRRASARAGLRRLALVGDRERAPRWRTRKTHADVAASLALRYRSAAPPPRPSRARRVGGCRWRNAVSRPRRADPLRRRAGRGDAAARPDVLGGRASRPRRARRSAKRSRWAPSDAPPGSISALPAAPRAARGRAGGVRALRRSWRPEAARGWLALGLAAKEIGFAWARRRRA